MLSRLEQRVAVSNQTVKQFEAQCREAQATIDGARSALFPTVGPSLGDTRSSRRSSSSLLGSTAGSVGANPLAGGAATTTSTGGTTGTGGGVGFGGGRTLTTYSVQGTVNWDLDVWGRIRRQVESDVAAAQVSAADLANAPLSAQALLATDYFEMRSQDALDKLLADRVAAYADALRITRNQYEAGTADPSAYSAAQTQLDTAKALLANVGVLRSQYEHAIAVLTGVSPSELTLAPGALMADVAAAERAMQQQNALVGVQVAAYYPDISLSALYGYSGNPLGSLIQTADRVWSLGAQATQVLFEGGLRGAEVAFARAAYDASVASYRQTVLTAFQQV